MTFKLGLHSPLGCEAARGDTVIFGTRNHRFTMLAPYTPQQNHLLAALPAAGLIHYSRGKITVLDRPKVEARVCECYAVVKRESDRLLSRKTAIVYQFS